MIGSSKAVRRRALFGFLASLLGCSPRGGTPTSPDTNAVRDDPVGSTDPASAERRTGELLARMTLAEKLAYIGGDREFFIRAVPRLGIPEIKMSDGPSGCRNWGPSTAYPASIGIAASFDLKLAERVGSAMGRDCRARGVHVLLAPGVNIHRSPLGGRNFEYRGEDPFLAGKSAAAFIRGVQREGVLATVKHFAANNQEWDRNHVSSEVDERTLREIYFPAFERAVREAGVAAVMTAYNPLNGTYCSHDPFLLRDVLKRDWKFQGFVMSDWGAVHDGRAAAVAGCDLEMPSGKFMNGDNLLPLLERGELDQALIDAKIRRILQTIVSAGFLNRPQRRDDVPLDDPTSAEVALVAARQSIVLLKNDAAVLPLDRGKLKRIAVIGPNAFPAVVGGSGSAFVTPFHAVSLLEGVKAAATSIDVMHHPGLRQPSDRALLGKPCFSGNVRQEIYAGQELGGNPISTSNVDRIDFHPPVGAPIAGVPAEGYSIRWSGSVNVTKAGRHRLVTNTDDGVRVFLDGKPVIVDWSDHAPNLNTVTVDLSAGKHAVIVEYYQGRGGAVAEVGFAPASAATVFQGSAAITALARQADAVIVSIGFGQSAETNSANAAFPPFWPPPWARAAGLVEAEDTDRPFELPSAQIETVRLAAAANPRTIVIVNAGGAIDLSGFSSQVPALLWAFYPGQEGGRALSEILFGEVNPSAKLPVTFAKRYADYPSAAYYNLNQNGKTPYTEGVLVGYRGFDARGVEPEFPFGFGLSYTTFQYSDLVTTLGPNGSVNVTFSVENRGARAGDEVALVFVSPPKTAVVRAPRELKGFERVTLAPGERKAVSILLEPRSFAYWNDQKHAWEVEPGAYEISAGSSSRSLQLHTKLDVGARVLPL